MTERNTGELPSHLPETVRFAGILALSAATTAAYVTYGLITEGLQAAGKAMRATKATVLPPHETMELNLHD